MSKPIEELLKKLHIRFKNKELYVLALTHPSHNTDTKTKNEDYERLEFMGDAVIGFVSADLIYKVHPEMDPGLMSKLRSYLVKTQSLANYARKVNFADYIITGQSVKASQINESNKMLEDAFEAFVGATYLDLGIRRAFSLVKFFLYNDIKHVDVYVLTDPKTRLQEEMQAHHQDRVNYKVVNTEGPAHDRTFTVQVIFNNIVLATGKGKSIKEAEEDAALKALNKKVI